MARRKGHDDREGPVSNPAQAFEHTFQVAPPSQEKDDQLLQRSQTRRAPSKRAKRERPSQLGEEGKEPAEGNPPQRLSAKRSSSKRVRGKRANEPGKERWELVEANPEWRSAFCSSSVPLKRKYLSVGILEVIDKCNEIHDLSLNDAKGLEHFMTVRLKELTTRPLRDILTIWIKNIEPRRQKIYGTYDGSKRIPEEDVLPSFWPSTVSYAEPRLLSQDCQLSPHISLTRIHLQ
ncbi:hypothetical protein N0V90_013376 [Kalmusia sp. IMI 367209]|nr:hypothetical protein N0V90_013376 [Kalmusia sp. IMI 367209]